MNPRCMGCMSEIPSGMNFCPVCGYKQGNNTSDGMYIPEGSMVGQYLIGRVLGHGGFGITYIGWDTARQQVVAVKEFFPAGMVGRAGNHTVSVYPQKRDAFDQGLERFQREAEMIRGFSDFPGIVEYRDYFQMQGTGYFVMEYVEGVTMKDYVAQRGGRIPFKDARAILMPIMDALEEMHRNRIIHRDISPENIYITKDKRVKLLDFGAARYDNVNEDRSLSIILKHGYAPKEQYFTQGRQGPWTDVYAVAATAYHMMSGRVPQSSIERMENDRLATLSQLGVAIPTPGEQVVMKALALSEDQRFPQMKAFQTAMLSVNVDEAAAMPSYQSQPVQPMPSVQPIISAQSMQPPTPVQSVQPVQQQAFSVQPYTTPSMQPSAVANPPAVPKKMKSAKAGGKKKLVLWIAAAAILIGGGLGGWYLIQQGRINAQNESIYLQSITLIQDESYDEAITQLNRLPNGYKDTPQRLLYIQGIENLKALNYQEAKENFVQVQVIIPEAQVLYDYASAGLHLENGDYQEALILLETINIPDEHQLLLKSQYQKAKTLMAQQDYTEAMSIFTELNQSHQYKDASQYIKTYESFSEDIQFQRVVELYQNQQYTGAAIYLSKTARMEAAHPYIGLLFAHRFAGNLHSDSDKTLNTLRFAVRNSQFNDLTLNIIANILMEYPDYEDASDLLMSDALIKYYLKGRWISDDGMNFSVMLSGTSPLRLAGFGDDLYEVDQDIIEPEDDGAQFREGVLYFGSDDIGWIQYFKVEYISIDQIKLTLLEDGRTWIMTRR